MSFLGRNVWASDVAIQKGNTQAFPYQIIVPPATTAVTLATVKAYLRIPVSDTSQDAILTLMIEAATEFAEMYTKRDFITRTSRTFRNEFESQFELRRSVFQSLELFEYLVSGSFIAVPPTVFSTTIENAFSFIFRLPEEDWPDDKDDLPQSIKIEFKTGFGNADTDVPSKLRLALLQHIASFFENRGDCACDADGAGKSLPAAAKAIYEQFRIMDISVVPRVF